MLLLKDLEKGHYTLKERPRYLGFTAAQWNRVYNNLLIMRDEFRKVLEGHPYLRLGLSGPGVIIHYVAEGLKLAFNTVIQAILNISDDITKEMQTLLTNADYGTDPTHTQIAKDDLNHPLNPLAGELAVEAVKHTAQRIRLYWKGGDPETFANEIAEKFFIHPCKTYWMDQLVLTWAAANSEAIKKACDPSRVEKVEQHIIENMDELEQKIKELLQWFK